MKQVVKRDINKVAGSKMRMFRVGKGLEQSTVAKRLGMTPGSYSKIEAGLTDVNYSRLVQIAGVLNVKIADLLCDDPATENWNTQRLFLLAGQIQDRNQRLQVLNQQLLRLLNELITCGPVTKQ